KEGADFEELIQRHMDNATRLATNNGRLDWVDRNTSGFKELEEVLFKLQPGEVGGLVESPFSFHIVKVLERRSAGVSSFAELKPEITEFLTEQKIDQAFRQKLNELRSEAKIEILDSNLAKAWEESQKQSATEAAEETTQPEQPQPPSEAAEDKTKPPQEQPKSGAAGEKTKVEGVKATEETKKKEEKPSSQTSSQPSNTPSPASPKPGN
ncbi:MAG: peptidylprolyl isomerase, partial [Deltaproteobacteria bacterium]|nr:peptidylprolyl isomerase [Deltaproteobacteria bacterium]